MLLKLWPILMPIFLLHFNALFGFQHFYIFFSNYRSEIDRDVLAVIMYCSANCELLVRIRYFM